MPQAIEMFCAPVLVDPLPGPNQTPNEVFPRPVRDDDVTQLQEYTLGSQK
jgi:hypothetical protein